MKEQAVVVVKAKTKMKTVRDLRLKREAIPKKRKTRSCKTIGVAESRIEDELPLEDSEEATLEAIAPLEETPLVDAGESCCAK